MQTMSVHDQPLVSVVTPVYNGAQYLRECIESVLAQTYSNWEYTIVNNCSTDGTLAIAEEYAERDKRIRVYSNDSLLDIIANHNRAFRLLSPDSKYCKVVSADDWLFPECLTKMVSVAEANPSVGIVGSYQLSGGGPDWRRWRVRGGEMPYPSTVTPGREVCRLQMLGGPYVFGNPTSSLYRSDLVRAQDSFYPNSTAEADKSACYKCLQDSDFGFVHQVLSYERVHAKQMTEECRTLNTYVSSDLRDLLEYGRNYLTAEEIDRRLKEIIGNYYRFLAGSVFRRRDKAFWNYHKKRLDDLGHPFSNITLTKAVCVTLLDLKLLDLLLLNPKQMVGKILRRLAA